MVINKILETDFNVYRDSDNTSRCNEDPDVFTFMQITEYPVFSTKFLLNMIVNNALEIVSTLVNRIKNGLIFCCALSYMPNTLSVVTGRGNQYI